MSSDKVLVDDGFSLSLSTPIGYEIFSNPDAFTATLRRFDKNYKLEMNDENRKVWRSGNDEINIEYDPRDSDADYAYRVDVTIEENTDPNGEKSSKIETILLNPTSASSTGGRRRRRRTTRKTRKSRSKARKTAKRSFRA
jgi:hypothetical protein